WRRLAQGQRRACEPRPAQGDVSRRELPLGDPRRPCRALRGLRPQSDRLQLVWHPPCPEVPGRGGARLACRARGRSAAGRLLPHGLHPAEIAPIAYQNKMVVYDLLFRTAAETLLTIAADPRHLGARIGFTAVL